MILVVRRLVNVAATAFVVAATNFSFAQTVNNTAPAFVGQTEGTFVIKDFRFRDEEALPELRLHYVTLGSPHRNPSNEIDNAILLLHSTGGDTTEFFGPEFSEPLFGAGKAFDLAKFYIIIPDAIGHGKSSKPSDGLRAHFPHYDYEDMVTAQYRLVTQKLGVSHLRLVMGLSMGGMHTWLWGERYADMMDTLMPISALPVEIAGRNRLWRRMVIDAIRDDPEWKNGDYEQEPHGYARIVPLIAMMVSSPVRLYEKYPTRASADAFYEHLLQVGTTRDANDRLYQYDASRNYNPTADLDKIKAKLLLIVFADDQINSPEFGALDREMPHVINGRFVIAPAGKDSDGEGNNTNAKLWHTYLEDLLSSVTR
jgi:homoserine O-acetyltransferase/O-succinyltransferase